MEEPSLVGAIPDVRDSVNPDPTRVVELSNSKTVVPDHLAPDNAARASAITVFMIPTPAPYDSEPNELGQWPDCTAEIHGGFSTQCSTAFLRPHRGIHPTPLSYNPRDHLEIDIGSPGLESGNTLAPDSVPSEVGCRAQSLGLSVSCVEYTTTTSSGKTQNVN